MERNLQSEDSIVKTISFVKWIKILQSVQKTFAIYPKVLYDIHINESITIKPHRASSNVKIDGYIQERYSRDKKIISAIASHKDGNGIFTNHDACEDFFKNVFFNRIVKEALLQIDFEPEYTDWRLCCSCEYVTIGSLQPYAKFILCPNLGKAVEIMFGK